MNACTESEGNSVECMKSLRGLRAGRTYEAWVRASTAAGEGPPLPAVACQTSALGESLEHKGFEHIKSVTVSKCRRQ